MFYNVLNDVIVILLMKSEILRKLEQIPECENHLKQATIFALFIESHLYLAYISLTKADIYLQERKMYIIL